LTCSFIIVLKDCRDFLLGRRTNYHKKRHWDHKKRLSKSGASEGP